MKQDKLKKTEEIKPHYVCTGGCLYVSDKPGKCPNPGCPRARNPLTLCNCTDGKHGDLLYKNAQKIAQ